MKSDSTLDLASAFEEPEVLMACVSAYNFNNPFLASSALAKSVNL